MCSGSDAGVIDDDVTREAGQSPKPDGQRCHIWTNVARIGRRGKDRASAINFSLYPVRCAYILSRNVGLYSEQIEFGLRGEEIGTHARRFCSSHARFLSAILARTIVSSANSPRAAACHPSSIIFVNFSR